MKISVIIPAYNAAKYIKHSIISVLNQTYQPYEIIVIDDGSTDDTYNVIKNLSNSSYNIRYYRQSNKGVASARNVGIELARGDWIAFLDADDIWLPFKLERQSALLKKNPDLVWCNGNIAINYGKGAIETASIHQNIKIELQNKHKMAFFKGAFWGINYHINNCLIKSSVLKSVRFDESLHISEDRDFMWTIATKYPIIGYVSDAISIYNATTINSLMKKGKDRNDSARTILKIYSKIKDVQTKHVYPYLFLKRLSVFYIMRKEIGQVEIDPKLINKLKKYFANSLIDKIFLYGFAMCPMNQKHFMLNQWKKLYCFIEKIYLRKLTLI